MKIAIVTNNGELVSRHFGRAPYFKILTIENGVFTNEQLVERSAYHSGPHNAHPTEEKQHLHSHSKMIAELEGCDQLIAGGMGYGAYTSLESAGIKVVLTDLKNIESVKEAIMTGTLENYSEERVH